MKNTIVGFVLGAAIGCAGTFYICKKYYEAKNEEDVESVKEAFRTREQKKKSKNKPEPEKEEDTKNVEKEKEFKNYQNIAKKYSSDEKTEEPSKTKSNAEPYSIAPDEFGEFEEYDKITLYYYSDGTLADENDEVVGHPEESVGADFEDAIGEWEEDCGYIRNDVLKCDYEILVDPRAFSSVYARSDSGKETS